ncbi:hypothetical protein ZIOFF_020686 [Zingiber officinale]|uniref:Core Histone H2A/H2B/H3 domain-containing protein n=1 Tax=Zingiber officinale TaxID=94328 RepID=A0A8J5GZ81_ZINOF|nr:hypothetical protein ZIOFF_020686 [Zingiber officinale]
MELGTQRQTEKRSRRSRPGVVALREIRRLQKLTKLLIPFAPFARLIREITGFYSREVTRWTPDALLALQEAAECHLQAMFEDAYLCSIHAKRVTLSKHLLLQWAKLGVESIGGWPDALVVGLFAFGTRGLVWSAADVSAKCQPS